MTRKLKVYYGSRHNRDGMYTARYKVPRIDLSGNWLSDLGFVIGDSISVHCADNKIIIENLKEKEELAYA
ncbi:MAG: SymE family type I addiction module toxin [Phascolarctobacterium sp.]|nr:SymE family type I addiction module toxin [Candidatus Phascolarctobacterium caballi]